MSEWDLLGAYRTLFCLCMFILKPTGAKNGITGVRTGRRRWGQTSFRSVDSWDDGEDADAGVSISKKTTISSLKDRTLEGPSCRLELFIFMLKMCFHHSCEKNTILSFCLDFLSQRTTREQNCRATAGWTELIPSPRLPSNTTSASPDICLVRNNDLLYHKNHINSFLGLCKTFDFLCLTRGVLSVHFFVYLCSFTVKPKTIL